MAPTPPPHSRRSRVADWPLLPLRKLRPETVPVRTAPCGPRLVRFAMWSALGAGPLALAATLYAPPTAAVQAAPAPHPAEAHAPADPRGVAELFVDLWLRADGSDTDGSIASAVRALAPEVDLPKRPRSAEAPAAAGGRVVAVRTVVGSGTWTVVVAALRDQAGPAPAGSPHTGAPLVRYYAVSGTGGAEGTPVAIGGAPAEVAAPDAAAVPDAQFLRRVPAGGALETSLGEFVRAYLGGGQGGGLERYLSPGLRVSAPKTAVYVRAEVIDVLTDAEAATASAVPADGTKARVRIRVSGEDRLGVRWPLVYRAEVTARAGRWEVSALEAGIADLPAGADSPSSAAVLGGGR
ncbi:conjugal transfer protein [Streptomyces sp. NRRL F-2664]|uniref:conjugal transfer protein n=1 Tax=Streptomyces sp. NRRL F-2664 TaxID=1463842 RepID=UPI000B0C0E3C|nr:conjugal transfer protein [Streptomyces sp. NRRL F-2664]